MLNHLARDLLGIEAALLNVNNLFGVIWVTGIFFAPLIYLFVVGSLRRMDPSLEDSARVTGAGSAPHHPDHQLAARRAGHPFGRDYRLRHQRRGIRSTLQVGHALRLGNPDHPDIHQGRG